MGRTALSKRKLQRAGILARVKAQELPLKDAAVLMRVSYRQAKRLWRRYRASGAAALKHGNAAALGISPRCSRTGRVLITGGLSGSFPSQVLASAELYNPPVLVPAPVLLSLSGDGKGQGAIQHAGSYRIASAADPAGAGEYLSIYLAGLADGSVIPPQLAIGGRLAEITFFGAVPGYPDLDVVNMRMPSGVTPGDAVPVRLTYLSRPSNEVTIGVQ